MLTRSKAKNQITNPHCLAVTTSPSAFLEPSIYQEAFQTPAWTQAMHDEFQALQTQKIWSLVPLPFGKHVIGCKWVYKLKKNSDGSIARHKARLVAKGYLQEEGVDFQETFSPVAKQPTVRILLCLALHYHWPLKQLDISNAFLHGKLEEEVYMSQPPGFLLIHLNPNMFVNYIKRCMD